MLNTIISATASVPALFASLREAIVIPVLVVGITLVVVENLFKPLTDIFTEVFDVTSE